MDFSIRKGQDPGMIGESGLRQERLRPFHPAADPMPPGKIISGEILFEGEDLLRKSKHEIKKIRGNDISMIFQEPMTSLNPVFTIGDQIMEPILLHQKVDKARARQMAIEMLDLVGIPPRPSAWMNTRTSFPADAAARHDRHGALLPAQAADRDEPTTALMSPSRPRSWL